MLLMWRAGGVVLPKYLNASEGHSGDRLVASVALPVWSEILASSTTEVPPQKHPRVHMGHKTQALEHGVSCKPPEDGASTNQQSDMRVGTG